MTNQRRLKMVILNGLVAALYVVLSLFPGMLGFASGAIQFRISEGLNHLVVFNKKYLWGVFGGVLVFNFFFSSENKLLDTLFGGGQTLLALLILTLVMPYLKQTWQKMLMNILLFTGSMSMIAWMIVLTGSTGGTQMPFWPTYISLALSEGLIMTITAPIMYMVDKVVHFDAQMKS
ncbi:QueT transporter family protein [Latilactobacillus graminis]|uniref:QueT transporter family protein n=2 Tax=Latilactobacillus graminis TaxID=60519 RepID=A0AA89I2Y5_9LACO|nr:QueT transporter family protein [Latilactobacillus graminis]KRM24474.1 queT transporter family protein [Latilactobacillus graminis DSM 20719]QFP79068.1 QueT transporter family protein [Latilactobacillus graminis]